MAVLTALDVPGTQHKWLALGFDCGREGFLLSHVHFRIGAGAQALGFDALSGDATRLGVPAHVARKPQEDARHPNLIDGIDHVVYAVPDLDAAIAMLDALLDDTPRRRARPRGPQGPEMAFYRVGDAILEVVGSGKPPSLNGVAFRCPDLDATVAAVRATGFESIGDPKPAVQGGRIASVWRGWVGMPIAVMEPKGKP